MTSETFSTYSLRTIAVTEFQWIALSATSLEDHTAANVGAARAVNLKTLHDSLAEDPTSRLGVAMTWREPTPDMKITLHDTLVKQDLMTGEAIYERELGRYVVTYGTMDPEGDQS